MRSKLGEGAPICLVTGVGGDLVQGGEMMARQWKRQLRGVDLMCFRCESSLLCVVMNWDGDRHVFQKMGPKFDLCLNE